MSDQNQPQGQINIELDEKTAEGTYSNLAIIIILLQNLLWIMYALCQVLQRQK